MDTFYIYHIWRRDLRFGSDKKNYFLEETTNDLDYAQAKCSSGTGEYIYTMSQAFYVMSQTG